MLLGLGSCGRSREAEPARARAAGPLPLPIEVFADSAASRRLRVEPPPARAWIARVTPSRIAASEPALPEAEPDTRIPESPPPPLEIDPGLKPPILRHAAKLVLPPGRTRGRVGAAVDLEVHVDETGVVSEAAWAGGSRDTALVNAARRCALGMRFYPALRGDRPVAVWCRQRFDFSRSSAGGGP